MKPVFSHTVHVLGNTLHYIQNDTAGKPVVFLHGNSLSSSSFYKQFEADWADDYRLIALDLVGHGKSSLAQNPEEVYTYAYFVQLVTHFLEALQLQDYVLVGHSMGGHIIMEGLPVWHGMCSFVLFGAPPAKQPLNIGEAFQPNENLGLLFKPDLSEAEKELIIDLYLSTPVADRAEILQQFSSTDEAFRPHLGKNLALQDEAALMQQNSLPVAILEGVSEKLVTKGYIDSLGLPALWRGQVQYIPEAGHSPQWENPQAFNAVLGAFLQGVL